MSDCLFCKIIKGEIPCHALYKDSHVTVFLDIHPCVRGHALIVPHRHEQNALSSSSEDLDRIMQAVKTIAPVMEKVLGARAFNLTSNIGAAAGQSIFHTHFHLIPRYEDDGLHPWPTQEISSETLQEMAVQIRSELETGV